MPVVRSLYFLSKTIISLISIGSTFIELDDVRVPVENRIGEENNGFPLIMSSKFRTRVLYLASLLTFR